MEKLGLVLSGGGSKGAYEIGVCKALKKLNINIDLVTGTSIGAVNGMFIAQNDLRNAIKFWKHISFNKMYKEEDFPPMEDPELSKVYAQYIKTFINEGGMNLSKIEKMFDNYFKPYKFFNSNIDYGLVTYNFSKRKPVIKKKDDMTRDNVKGYVIASATCYPAFKPYIIDNELYIDGGYYDNIPINLAIEMGATKIIAVDLRAVGLKKKISDESVEVTYICPRNKIASFLVFDKERAKEAMRFGYNDAMKTFGKLEGDKFTFRKYNLIKNYNLYNDIFEDNLNNIFKVKDNVILNKIFESAIFNEIISRKTRYNNFNKIIEKAGKIFKFDESNIYDIHTYNKGLLNALSNTESIDVEKVKNKLKDKDIANIIDSRQITKYFYENILNNNKNMLKYIPLFNDEFLTALYIYTIKGRKITY
ncbi:MAG: patatin-like phospholipase family protein [Bacilli bacterium]|nr:patatin-like phospholipase family protein [Bacilli bacterium]